MFKIKKNIILCAFSFIICLLVTNFAFAANEHLRDLNRRDYTPFNEKLRLKDAFPTSSTQLKGLPSSPSAISGPKIYKSPVETEETRIKPSYGREKPKKKKEEEYKPTEFKIDPILIRYLEAILFVYVIVFFIRREMKRMRKKGLKDNKNSSRHIPKYKP